MAAKTRHWFGCGFLLGLVLFGLLVGTAMIRSDIWRIGVPAIIIGALAFGALSAYYKETFWNTIFRK